MNAHSKDINAGYATLHAILGPVFPISSAKTSSPEDSFFLDTKDSKVRIHVQYKKNEYVIVGLAFLQRKGVWHDLGNFFRDPEFARITKKFGVEDSSYRIDSFGHIGTGSIEAFAKALVASQADPVFAVGQKVTYLAGGKVSRLEGVSGKWMPGIIEQVSSDFIRVMPEHRTRLDATFKGMGASVGVGQVRAA